MKSVTKIMTMIMSVILLMTGFSIRTRAELVNIEGNSYFSQSRIPVGATGRLMSITFTFEADRDYENAWAGLAYDDQINASDDKENPEKYAYPFELSKETIERKHIGRIKAGQKKNITLTARVRRDIPEGYYGVQVYISPSKDSGERGPQEYVNVWIKKASEVDKEEEIKAVSFVLGENQNTPYGKYPSIMNFGINLRNRGKVTAHDVTASIVLDRDNKVFPFDINEVNYDRYFEKVEHDETVSLDYSFAIRKDTYSGYYPIKLKISYKESSDGPVKISEHEFFVNIVNKEEEDKRGDFNANDRSKARIIVDSYHTIPENIIAGEDFELVVNMKNASSSVSASNILFSFEPEKVSDRPVFSTESGSNSIVINNLAQGAVTELRMKMKSKPGIEQRSYNITIKEKYDSPEFKNAEETVVIDIPINQIPKLNIGTIDISPEKIMVGDEANITFPINNTGRVMLYNVMVKFEADSIKTNDIYVGNIKPGETGNVDIMLTGKEVTNDDGSIKMTISYEDENGTVSSEEKNLILRVEEPMEDENQFLENEETQDSAPKSIFKGIYLIPILLLVAGIVALTLFIKKRKSKENI